MLDLSTPYAQTADTCMSVDVVALPNLISSDLLVGRIAVLWNDTIL